MKRTPRRALFLILSVCLSLNAFAENTLQVRPLSTLKNTLQPFSTDRCSYAIDGTWTDCCLQHDYGYWQGGSEADRLKVDDAFYSCMEKASDAVIAGGYYHAVRWFGGAQNASFRWGYGWKYPRALRPLNEEELNLVKRTPFNLEEARKMVPSKAPAPLPFPSATGNLCLDEVVFMFIQGLHFEPRLIKYAVQSQNPLQYKISFPEFPGSGVYLATMAATNESACLAFRWSEEPTHFLKNLTTTNSPL
ncbi:MAG: phospholipase [Bdellovibrionales bacterium]|nr:phospholipase [Bdellovibrionales bacterium]